MQWKLLTHNQLEYKLKKRQGILSLFDNNITLGNAHPTCLLIKYTPKLFCNILLNEFNLVSLYKLGDSMFVKI